MKEEKKHLYKESSTGIIVGLLAIFLDGLLGIIAFIKEETVSAFILIITKF